MSQKIQGSDVLRSILTHVYGAKLGNRNRLPKQARTKVNSLVRNLTYILDDKPVIEAMKRLAFVLNNPSADQGLLLTNLAVAEEQLQKDVV